MASVGAKPVRTPDKGRDIAMNDNSLSMIFDRVLLVALLVMIYATGLGRAGLPDDLQISLYKEQKHPFLACTEQELARLRRAYRPKGPAKKVVAQYVAQAERFIREPVVFPPRGGQHNQWYQCQKCELALKTIDDTHHKCPQCKKVYSGHPYDDVIFSRQHGRNLSRLLTAAWAYAISGQKKYAEYTARVLLGYADRYKKYPYHSASLEVESSWGKRAGGHLFEQTLTEASSLSTRIAPAYDLIHDAGVLSGADHQTVREGLLLPMLRNIDKNKAGKSNWQSWHNTAMLWGGALLGEAEWVRKAVTDQKNGFLHQMKISVSNEGMWYENSWGYHFYTLRALVLTAEGARRLGIDIWQDETFKKMFTLPVRYTMANGMLPRFGDDVNSSVARAGSLWEAAYNAYRDPVILALLSDKPSFDSVLLGRADKAQATGEPLESAVFKDAGHAVLRTHSEAGLTAALTFGPYGGFHGHYDKLSFVFYGYGRELGVDPGRARSQAYRLPIHTKWYKATIGHNTVLVDGNSQKPAAGKLELFAANQRCAAVAASCFAAYPGVKHERLLVMMGTYLLVVDELHADKERRFDWIYHNRGSKVLSDIATKDADIIDSIVGSDYIRNTKCGITNGLVRVQFVDEGVKTYLTMAGRVGTKVTVGDGVGAAVTDRVPLTIATRFGRDMFFATVLEPVRRGVESKVQDISLNINDSGLTIIVKRVSQIDTIELLSENQVSVKTGAEVILSTK